MENRVLAAIRDIVPTLKNVVWGSNGVFNIAFQYETEYKKSLMVGEYELVALQRDYYAPQRLYVYKDGDIVFEVHYDKGLKKCELTNDTLGHILKFMRDSKSVLDGIVIDISEENKKLLKEFLV